MTAVGYRVTKQRGLTFITAMNLDLLNNILDILFTMFLETSGNTREAVSLKLCTCLSIASWPGNDNHETKAHHARLNYQWLELKSQWEP